MNETKKTQASEILRYLTTHKKGITSMEAFEMFGATRLSAIIYNLRYRGYEIESDRVDVKTRYGRTVSISRYTLVGDKNEKKSRNQI